MPDFSTILKEIWEILLIFLHSIYASLMRVIWPGPGKSLLGEIAIVTGAGHGIGRELSLQLGKKKMVCQVYLHIFASCSFSIVLSIEQAKC